MTRVRRIRFHFKGKDSDLRSLNFAAFDKTFHEFSSRLLRNVGENVVWSLPAEAFPLTLIEDVDKALELFFGEGIHIDATMKEVAKKFLWLLENETGT